MNPVINVYMDKTEKRKVTKKLKTEKSEKKLQNSELMPRYI